MRNRPLRLEPLEPRIVLDAGPLITEFMAINDSTLADEHGNYRDWIEIHNPTSDPINLDGWYLTDNADNLDKWQFPAVTLAPGEYRVVFASGDGNSQTDPAGELHTDWKLSGDGEDVAIVRPDGVTVAHAYLDYPEQVADLSYGISVPVPFFDELVGDGAAATYHVPTEAEDVFAWTAPAYDDSLWEAPAATGIGFSNNQPAFDNLIGTDVETDMKGENASLWTRIEFTSGDPSPWDRLTLRMKYDDGFVAYLNGQEMARQNAPAELAFDSAATDAHPDAAAVVFEDFDVSDALSSLSAGTNVLAIHGLNVVDDDADFLILPQLTAGANLGDPFYMATATPGEVNDEEAQEVVADTKFSVDRGFYDTPFQVEITTATVGATIKYTTDGSEPSLTHGTVYTVPITIDTTTPLRAMAYKTGALSTNIDTLTYIFLDDVIHQDGAGYPNDWGGGYPGDYQMASDVVNNPVYAATIKDDLLSIPTLSLVTDIDNLFDPSIGIYYNPTNRGASWERPVSAELILPDNTTEFQIDAGLRVHGGAGRNRSNAKHSLRLLFKDEYGDTKLDYPWFEYDDPEAADSFDTIVLRAGFNDQWRGTNATYIQDPWIAKSQNLNGGYGPHGSWVHLYLNGLYWGLYNPVERPGASFAASYLGGEKEDYDAYHTNQLKDGTSTAWNQLFATVRAPTDPENYTEAMKYADVSEILDIPNFIDYMIINQYGHNGDWPHNNWDATFNRNDPDGKWRFHSWDAEFSLRSLTGNLVNYDYRGSTNAGEIFKRLVTLPEFQMAYADRIHRLMFNDGVLTPAKGIETLNFLVDQIDRAIVGESARWGDGAYSARGSSQTQANWLSRINWLRDTYFPQRTDIVLNQFRTTTLYPQLYPDIVAPAFSQHGGDVLPDDAVTVSAPAGVIYYTMDGTDPRLEGGAIHPNAIPIATGETIPLLQSATVKSRVLDGEEWSALNEAAFNVTLTGVTINIDGVPSQGGHLPLDSTLTLTAPDGTIYYTLDGTDPRQPDGTIHPGAVAVASGAPIPVAQSVGVTTRAWLDNQGSPVWSPLNQAVFLMDTPSGPHHLVISEINYNPLDASPAELAVNPGLTGSDFEYIELQYTGADPVNLSGLQLINGVTFDFGDQSPITLDNGDYVLVVANQQAFEARYDTGGLTIAGQFDGNLDNAGERIELAGPFGETIIDFVYGDGGSWPGRPDGRGASLELIDPFAVPSGVPESNPDRIGYLENGDHWRGSEFGGSPGAAGSPLFVDVVVNEVLSHTDLPQTDSIELYNTTGGDIDISGWYLSDSWGAASNPETGNYKKFRIPNGTIIPAYGYVTFDENDFNPSLGTDPEDFALDGAHGDEVWLMQADSEGNLTRFAEHVEFGAAANGESFGRWPNGSGELHPMISVTLDDVNSGPRVGNVIISEVMYHPTAPTESDLAIYPALTESDLEYIEIFNPTDIDEPLANWRLRGDADFDFPAITLGHRQARLILPFDPAKLDEQGQPVNQQRTNAFRNHYQLHPFIPLIGGYKSQLDNKGDRVQLQRADEPPMDEPGFYPSLWEDQINYKDDPPWPVMADGTGKTLSRYLPAGWGDDAASWTDTPPTPGRYVPAEDTLDVVSVTPAADGFTVQLDQAIDPASLNLYDTETGALGPADITLVGETTGPVSGSLVVGTDSITFLATGGPLAGDTYTVTLSGATAGLLGTGGQLLAGDAAFTPGSDYVTTFDILPEPVTVGLPDFARGPGQEVNVPAMDAGIPLWLTDNRAGGAGIESVDVTITYDPALLTITQAALGPGAPAGATLVADTNTAGQVSLSLSSPATPLPAGETHLVTLTADVPWSATYGESQVLMLTQLDLRDTSGVSVTVAADDALHSVTYFGDSTRNGTYSALDPQLVARVGVGLDSGFEDFPITDPRAVADITRDGAISGYDAQRIALVAAGFEVDRIPPLPQQPQRLSVPTDSSGSRQTFDAGSGESIAESGEPEAVVSDQLSVISYQLSVISYQLLAPASHISQPASPVPHSAFRIPHSPDLSSMRRPQPDDESEDLVDEEIVDIEPLSDKIVDSVFAFGVE